MHLDLADISTGEFGLQVNGEGTVWMSGVGLEESVPPHAAAMLASLNDGGATFDQIAYVIEVAVEEYLHRQRDVAQKQERYFDPILGLVTLP